MAEINGSFCNRSGNTTTEGDADGANILSPILMFLAGFLGNVWALIVLHRTRNQSVFYALVAGLVWTDLIGISLTSPVTILNYVNGRRWVGGQTSCNFVGFMMICFGLATPFIACAMAIERLLAIKFHYFYSSKCNNNSARCLIVFLWMSVVMFGLLPFFGYGRYEVQYPCTWCFLDFHSRVPLIDSYALLYACLNLVIVVLMVLCNGYVMITLFKVRYIKKKAYEQGECSDSNNDNDIVNPRSKRKKQGKLELQMIILMCVITTIFAVCWAPLMIQIIFTVTTGEENKLLDLAAIRLASLNQTLDPWMYIILRKSLFLKVSRTVKRVFCCGNSHIDNVPGGLNQPGLQTVRHRRLVRNISLKKTFLKYFENVHFVDNIEREQSLQQGIERQSLPDVTRDTLRQVENDLPDIAERTVSCQYCRMKEGHLDCSTCSSSSSIHERVYVTIVLPNPGTITILSKNPKNKRAYITDPYPLAGSDDPLLSFTEYNSSYQNS